MNSGAVASANFVGYTEVKSDLVGMEKTSTETRKHERFLIIGPSLAGSPPQGGCYGATRKCCEVSMWTVGVLPGMDDASSVETSSPIPSADVAPTKVNP